MSLIEKSVKDRVKKLITFGLKTEKRREEKIREKQNARPIAPAQRHIFFSLTRIIIQYSKKNEEKQEQKMNRMKKQMQLRPSAVWWRVSLIRQAGYIPKAEKGIFPPALATFLSPQRIS